jgi:hypothetical protein
MPIQRDVNFPVVVGIRIGTKCTSITCLLSHERSYLSLVWHDSFNGIISQTQPSIAVYSPNMDFQAFGHEAVNQIREQTGSNVLVLPNFVQDIFCSSIHVRYIIVFINFDLRI